MTKPKINHDAKMIIEILPGIELREERMKKLYEDALNDPQKFFGDKKSQTVELIYDAVLEGDHEKVLVLGMIMVKGVMAVRAMAALEEHTREKLSKIPHSELPPEIRKAMKEAGMEAKEDEEPEDEYEKLKRKYGL